MRKLPVCLPDTNAGVSHLKKAHHYKNLRFLADGLATKASLDLTNARTGKKHGSLYWYLDEVKTAMGGRLLRSSSETLVDLKRIRERQDIQVFIMDQISWTERFDRRLKGVYDIERPSRVSFGEDQSWDALTFREILWGHVPTIKSILLGIGDPVPVCLNCTLGWTSELPWLPQLLLRKRLLLLQRKISSGGWVWRAIGWCRVVLRDGTGWITLNWAKKSAKPVALHKV